jgi:hypothetical protein
MLPSEVARIIGPHDAQTTNYLGELIEYRCGRSLITTYSSAEGLVEVGVDPGVGKAAIDGVSLFVGRPADVLQELAQRDGEPMELAGFVVLLKLGISLSGFQDASSSDLAVTAFVWGRWDSQLPKMKPFTLGSR